MDKNSAKKNEGFTLIEMAVAMFVLSLTLLSSVGVAGSYMRSRNYLSKYQQKVEDMSLVINDLAKRIRMSNCGKDGSACVFVSGSTKSIRFRENDDNSFVTYSFDNINNRLTRTNAAGSTSTVLEGVRGSFTISNPPTAGIPLVTIKMWKSDDSATNAVQTSVSQRAYY